MWDWIKDDLLRCIKNFMREGKLPGGFNSSFIALVPKNPTLVSPKYFMLISLINASMKLYQNSSH